MTNTIEFQYEPTASIVPQATITAASASANTQQNSVFGGGISVYYSLKLGLLFWSYQQGKTFIGAFKDHTLVFDKVFPLTMANSSKSASNGNQANQMLQPLCNWNEIANHPGLVMAMTYLSNNPVVPMLLPDKIYIQEIKLVNNQGGPSKAKIQDMVATRHLSSSTGAALVPSAAPTLLVPTGESNTNHVNLDEEDEDLANMILSKEDKKNQTGK